jgi:hypothetical protein
MAKTSKTWERFGSAVLAHPAVTLAAYLGAPWAMARAREGKIAFPKAADFRKDPVFDPNPHKLKLAREYLDTNFLVRTLAIWGWHPLVRAVVVCSDIQLEFAEPSKDKKRKACEAAALATKAFLKSPTKGKRAAARSAADACGAPYRRFERKPDAPGARETWLKLGACWFAAETAAQDFSLSEWDGPGPAQASTTWGNRSSVWPKRAAEAAAAVSSHELVRRRIAEDLIGWCLTELE